MEKGEMPVGFAMALAQNPDAMQRFAMMSEERQQEIVSGVHSVSSKRDMQRYVSEMIFDK